MQKERKFSIISDQGTAMAETVLTEEEYNSDMKTKTEEWAKKIRDCSNPLQWAEVTENDAFYEPHPDRE